MDLQAVNQQPHIEGEILKFGRCRCAFCGKKGKMGTTKMPDPSKSLVKIMCLDCTVEDIAKEKSLSSKDAKDYWEKLQKSQEILAKTLIERYETETGKKPPRNMEELAEIIQPAINWWNRTLPETERDRVSHLSKDEQKEYFLKAPLLTEGQQPIVKEHHTGRNDPCPCGSGKKFKKCCIERLQ